MARCGLLFDACQSSDDEVGNADGGWTTRFPIPKVFGAIRTTIKMNSPIQRTPDAESELLLRCCAVSRPDGTAMRELAGRCIDWSRFLAAANRNSVTPMISARLGAEGAADLPPHVARALRLSYQVNALRCNHLAGCAAEIVDSFTSSSVPVIAIKGPALAITA